MVEEASHLPPEEEPVVPPAEEAKLVDELQKMEYEPLLPVEKKLIIWSIGIGIIALGFLVWISYTFFPGGH
jgi:hypothetical protein